MPGSDLFSQVFSLCPDAINVNRLRDGLFLVINEGFTRLTGYTEEDVRGKSALDLHLWVNPEDRRLLLDRLLSGGEVGDFTTEFRLKSGLTKPGSLSARLITVEGEECLLSYTRDISERQMAKDALRQYHEAAFMIENAPMGIYIAQNGLLVYGNQWLREFCGIAMSDLPRDPLSVVVPEDRELVREQMVKRIRGEESLPQYTVRLPRHDGSIAHVELIAKVVTYRGRPAIQGSIVDISAKVAVEQQLRENAARLGESNQLRQLFNDILSHDLLDPLWAASGQAGLLADRVPPEHRDALRSLQGALGEAKEIIADAHAFLRLRDNDGLSFSTVDISALLREVAASFAPASGGKGVALAVRVPPALRAKANPVLRQAFSNLISNALKYGSAGSAVIIEAHDGPLVRVVFRNRGERIPPEFRERIFERFVQGGKRGIKGVGLGLAIVKRIADLHSGRAWVEDDPEGGCAFFFEFPCRQPGPDAPGA